MSQGNNPTNPSPSNDDDKTKEFSEAVKKFQTFGFRYFRLEDDPEKRKQQIENLLERASDLKTHVFIGYPFEAKNAPFSKRVAGVKELELA